MNIIAKRILDTIYPPRCPLCDGLLKRGEELICEGCLSKATFNSSRRCIYCGRPLISRYEDICAACLNNRHAYDEAFAPFSYAGDIREAVSRFKYRGRAEYAAFFARCIFEYGRKRLLTWEADAFVPVPVHSARLAKRGYNQAELIAKELTKLTGIATDSGLLKRVKNTVPQKELDPLERRKNLTAAFEYIGRSPAPKTAVIVDDIVTTGSTADALALLLKENGAKSVFLVSAA